MDWFDLLSSLDLMGLHIPLPMALAVVVTVGYVMGRARNHQQGTSKRTRREARQARCVARDLEKIARMVRKNISRHHASVSRFKQRVGALDTEEQAAAWKELCREAEGMLAPTLQLANQIAGAYDQIHQEDNPRLRFTENRTDSLTGLGNRRGLDETLEAELAMMDRYANGFSVAIFSLDHFSRINEQEGRDEGDRILASVARLLEEHVRETDVLTRYGGVEFAVVMRETDLAGASVFAERVRLHVERELPVTVSGGVSTGLDGDTTDTLLARADAGMSSAKSSGRNCVFSHSGEGIECVSEEALV